MTQLLRDNHNPNLHRPVDTLCSATPNNQELELFTAQVHGGLQFTWPKSPHFTFGCLYQQ